jgi:hypothetical protein
MAPAADRNIAGYVSHAAEIRDLPVHRNLGDLHK